MPYIYILCIYVSYICSYKSWKINYSMKCKSQTKIQGNFRREINGMEVEHSVCSMGYNRLSIQ